MQSGGFPGLELRTTVSDRAVSDKTPHTIKIQGEKQWVSIRKVKLHVMSPTFMQSVQQ